MDTGPERKFRLTKLAQRGGDFERVDYSLKEDPELKKVVVEGIEKSWGPNYLKFGLGYTGDFTSQQRFNVSMMHRMTWLNSLGFVGVVAGLITHPIVFFLGLIALLAAGTEWLVQSWSEGASSDKAYNASLRGRMLHPLEFPVLALVGLGIIILSFSRVMLAVSRDAGAIIFIVAGAVVLFAGSVFALKPSLKKTLVVGICVASAVGVAASGIAAASNGLRDDLVKAKKEHHFSHKECGEEESEHFDHLAEGTISMRSNPIATVELRDGKLTARELGVDKVTQTITFPRSNDATIIFRNKDEREARLTAYLGTKAVQDGVVEEVLNCTQMIGIDHEQALTFKIAKPSMASEKPYTLTVPGLEGQSIEIMVP
jgi:hypothetical protein